MESKKGWCFHNRQTTNKHHENNSPSSKSNVTKNPWEMIGKMIGMPLKHSPPFWASQLVYHFSPVLRRPQNAKKKPKGWTAGFTHKKISTPKLPPRLLHLKLGVFPSNCAVPSGERFHFGKFGFCPDQDGEYAHPSAHPSAIQRIHFVNPILEVMSFFGEILVDDFFSQRFSCILQYLNDLDKTWLLKPNVRHLAWCISMVKSIPKVIQGMFLKAARTSRYTLEFQ